MSKKYLNFSTRSIVVLGLVAISNSLGLYPLLAASTAPNTTIDNQATGTFTDGDEPGAQQESIVSNVVAVTVAEVTGITITPVSFPIVTSESVADFDFKIQNIGNDPTKFFLPTAPSNVIGGTAGTLQVVGYINAAGTQVNLAIPIDITTATNTGNLSDPTLGGNTTLGSIPADAAIVVRVPVTVTAVAGAPLAVTLGNTTGSPGNSNTPYLAGSNDVYTVDNVSGSIIGEAANNPINAPQEASATQQLTVSTPDSALGPVVTKTTSTPNVAAGGAATYTIKVTNPSNTSISDVSITDPLPTGFTYDATIGVPVFKNSAFRSIITNPTPGSTNPNWGTFVLPAGSSVAITFTANINDNQATGTYQNPVQVNYKDAGVSQTNYYNPSSSIAEDVLVTAAPALPPPPPPAPTRSAAGICAMPGKDGAADLSGVINTYYPGNNSSLGAGAQSMSVDPSVGANNAITVGDLLLVIQMQDATIDSSNTAAYGSGNTSNDGRGQTSMGSSGLYEYIVATNAVSNSGGTLTFNGAGGGGLINSYINANATSTRGQRRFQVVRVPQYANLRLSSTLRALEWNGRAGGIVVADVAGQLNFNGRTIDGINRGFRAGYSQKTVSNNSTLDYVGNSSTTIGAGKGEGTAGTPQFVWNGSQPLDNLIPGYPNGDYGRGAPANAGGGGNFHNAGGGGGGNGGVGGKGGIPWDGAGGAIDSGGRGGALSSLFTPDPSRLFLGGGGGGGDANNATSGVRGGVGAGLVILRAGTMAGTGTINVTGDNGDVGVAGSAPDGAGGGGAGGTVLVATRQNSSASLSIVADGGAGGNTLNDAGVPHGPGAGGGGGVVLYNTPGVSLNTSTLGGVNGKSNNGNGIAHGATSGQDGQAAVFTNASDPFATVNDASCLPKLTVWKTTTTPKVVQGGLATYKITVANAPGRSTALGVDIQDVLPTGFTYDSTATIVLGNGVTRSATINPVAGATTATWKTFDIPAGEKVEITFRTTASSTIAAGTYQNPAVATYLDPQRSNPTDTTSSNYDAVANSGEDVTITAPIVNNPNILLVKRITAINGLNRKRDGSPLNTYEDDSNNAYDDNNITILTQPTKADPPLDTDKWPTPSTFLLGAINGGNIKPNDSIEYTIYFLSTGDAPATNALFCDRVPSNVTFIPAAFNGLTPAPGASGARGISAHIYGGNPSSTSPSNPFDNPYSYSNAADNDAARYFPPGNDPTAVYPNINCGGVNDNGAVVFNLGSLPNATAPATPTSSYGFVRFQGRVK